MCFISKYIRRIKKNSKVFNGLGFGLYSNDQICVHYSRRETEKKKREAGPERKKWKYVWGNVSEVGSE